MMIGLVQPQHPPSSLETQRGLHRDLGPPWRHSDAGDSGLDDNEETHAAEISPDHEAPGGWRQ